LQIEARAAALDSCAKEQAMTTDRFRRVTGTALAAALLLATGAWLAQPHGAAPPDAAKNRTQTLREAFDLASSHCYETYQGAELQGCLVGAMQAHLQALGGGDEPSARVGVVGARRGDI
jgi:hypothetical protein